MLTHPTLDMLRDLGLHGMARAFQDLDVQAEARALDHGEWLAILLEHEATQRRQKRFEARARAARLRHDAQVEDVDFRAERGLDRSLFLKLASCDWIRQRHGLLLTGPAGVGKSWLACALGHKACRDDFSVAYHRALELPPESGPPTGIDFPVNWRISDGWKTREAGRDCIEAAAS
jgi:DNA replication protein DnaC